MADRTAKAAENRKAVEDKIAEWNEPYRSIGQRLHQLILDNADLDPRLWYGMPGYARGSGPALIFFRHDDYVSFGLTEKVGLDTAGSPDQLMASAWFLMELDEPTEQRLAAIVRNAVA